MTTAPPTVPPAIPPTVPPTAPPAVPPGGRPASRGRRRWHRLAVPFGLLVLVYLITGVAHAVQEPDLDEPGTLSPTGTGPDGSSRLADLLAQRGVTVSRATTSAAARDLLAGGEPTTVFVPAPDLVDPRLLTELTRPANRHRVVLVQPGWRAAATAGFWPGPSRWATRAVEPDCTADVAVAAGRAAVDHSSYETDEPSFSCYRGGLVAVPAGTGEAVVVGATDPFRNNRIDEVGNEALATGLLAGHRRVVWVDVHRAERPKLPKVKPSLPDLNYRQPDRTAGEGNPLWGAFPPVLWAGLILRLALGALVAVVRARRLGPPVPEPLPVLVPATEVVTGRGRLYRRASARAAALEALRTAALRQLGRVVAGTADDPGFVAGVAARAGLSPEQVTAILHPAEPTTDAELTAAVAGLDALVDTVLRSAGRPTGAGAVPPAGPPPAVPSDVPPPGTAGPAGADTPGGTP